MNLEQAARQALECLNTLISHHTVCYSAISESGAVDAEYALREALAEQAEQEPVGHLCEASFGRGQVFWFNKPADNTPLYAAPVRTKDLTDDEIDDVFKSLGFSLADPRPEDFSVARAVIAKDREKNK